MKRPSLIFITILAGFMTSTYAETPKQVFITNTPVPVTIQNDGIAQPYCPCFTTEEIEAALAGPPVECTDDRVVFDDGYSTTRIDSENTLIFVSGVEDASLNTNYGCSIGRFEEGGIRALVDFPSIGFTNMMACRLTIINSPSWQDCPTLP